MLGMVYMQFIQAQSVDEIINKYVEARGGEDKLKAVTSLYMEGSRQMMGNDIAVKVTKVQGKLFRTDFEFAGNKGYTIVTPNAGWSFIPMRSQNAEAIPEDRLKTMQTDLDIMGPIIDYASKGNKARLAGKEDIDGKEAYKVTVTPGSGKDITYYIDTKTNLLLQMRQMRAGMNGNGNEESEMITNYSDYSPVDGILFAHTLSNPGTGPGSGSMTFTKIELNKPVDESQYKPSN